MTTLIAWVLSFSLERIQDYTSIEQESEPTPEGALPTRWPASGEFTVKTCVPITARFAPNFFTASTSILSPVIVLALSVALKVERVR